MKNYFITALAGLLVACGQNTADILPRSSIQTISVQSSASTSTELISVTRTGDPEGQTLFFIPGLASSPDVWSETIKEFQDYDVRLVQVAGFAGAPKFGLNGNFTDAIAKAVNLHLANIPGKNTVIIGHSMGGFVSLKAALNENQNIDKLVIVDSLPFLAGMFMPGTTPEQAASSAQIMAAQMAAMPRADFDRQQEAGVRRLVKTRSYRATIKDWGKSSDQELVANTMGELLASDLRDNLSQISTEIHVMVAHDKAMRIPKSQIETLYAAQYAAAPNHTITVIEDSFHFIMIDQKEAFIAALREALGKT